MPHRRPRAYLWPMLLIVPLLLVSACSSTASTAPGTDSATVMSTSPTATTVPTAQARCQAVHGFSSAAEVGAAPGFSDVLLPAETILTTPARSGGSIGFFAITETNACTPSSSVSAIRAFFARGLPNDGWAQASTFPYDSGWQASCGDPYCWSKDTAPRYVSLEAVTDAGQGRVTYHLRLASPPAVPTGLNCGYRGFITDFHGIPLPPLSSLFGGSSTAYGGGASACSAGTAASIDAFFRTELPRTGWQQRTPSASIRCYMAGASMWWNGTLYFGYDLRSWTASQPYYYVSYCAP